MVNKGKTIAVKRKRNSVGKDDKSRRNRKNPGILQFFEEAADVDDSDLFDDDFMEEEFDTPLKVRNEPTKVRCLPFIPKEEEIDEEAFDNLMEERYKEGSTSVKYVEDHYENKRSVERNYLVPSSAKDPTIWKVKCTVGRERLSAFCLMQKFVDMQLLGTELHIISAFAVEHVKGFIYIEADKQNDANEACKGLFGIYHTRLAPIPKNEISLLLTTQSKCNEVSEGMWAYVKSGKYKGDLTQVVAVNNARKRATVKLIPRIDLQALAAKFGGGVALKTNAKVAPRLIRSSELEEFRPLIQCRRDRDTGKVFEFLDGLMLKDGYVYKKVSFDSLSFQSVVPSEEELLKFKPSENNEFTDMDWLSQLYGEQNKKLIITVDKKGDKGEGSSGSGLVNSFELYELVCLGQKDFGLIVGMEKDDLYKILKEGSDGPAVVTVERTELKNGPFDMKFTALDQHMKSISINDTVSVLEGPSQGKQGIIKQIYRGVIFVYDENETENGGYFCSKSRFCEKIKLSADACREKGGGSGSLGFEDFMSSPKSPLSPKKTWQARENYSDFKRGDKDGIFSVGQTLRIKVGTLKGYLCRVLSIRRSDLTVKLDSKQKVLTVRREHLAEVHGKRAVMSTSEDPGSDTVEAVPTVSWEKNGNPSTDADQLNNERTGWNNGKNRVPIAFCVNKDGSSGKKPDWNKPAPIAKIPTGSWDNAAGGNRTQRGGNTDEASGWKKSQTDSSSQTTNWVREKKSNEEAAGWGKEGSANQDQTNGWKKPKAFGADGGPSWKQDGGSFCDKQDGGGSSWGKQHGGPSLGKQDGGSLWNKQTDQQDGWEKSQLFDAGCDSGGRGRGLQGGIHQSGRGRSFGQGQSSGWKKEGPGNNWNNDGLSSGNRPSWNNDEAATWGKSKDSEGGGEAGWKSGSNGAGENHGSHWGKRGNLNSGSGDGNQDSGWGKKNSWNSGAGDANQNSSWGKQGNWNVGCGGGSQESNGGKKSQRNSGNGDQSKTFNDGTSGSRESFRGRGGSNRGSFRGRGSSDRGGFRGRGRSDRGGYGGRGRSHDWNSGSSSTCENHDWGKKGNWNSGSGDAGGNQDSTGGKRYSLNSGSGDANQF